MVNEEIIVLLWPLMPYRNDYMYWMYYDAFREGKAKLIMPPVRYMNSESVERIRRANTKGGILQKAWLPIYLRGTRFYKDKTYIVILNEWHPVLDNPVYISGIRRKYHVKVVLTLHNRVKNKQHPVIGVNHRLEDIRELVDLITTDEPEDAALYDMPYIPNPIFNMYSGKQIKVKNDLCFCGADKGRFDTIKEIAKLSRKAGVLADLKIANNAKYHVDGIEFISWQTYPETILQDLRANCILEVLQPGQNGYSLRMEEAVMLNKKLLTNNPLVKESKYYNPRYIYCFQKTNEIDWDFVKERIDVDYHYEGEYSGLYFIEQVKRMLKGDK